MRQLHEKTLQNLQEKPIAAFHVRDAGTKRCFQVKGHAGIHTSGPDDDEMYGMAKKSARRFRRNRSSSSPSAQPTTAPRERIPGHSCRRRF
ncbi:MAG TPA: hypothetical protein ENN85_02480 [Methanoculleus sp.]|nr:hypothetical protein [Methanoculleus sp.]